MLGHSDGSFGQYKTSLHSVKTIPSSLGNVPVAGMFWLSPHEFLVAYHCVSDSKTVVHFVITSKDQPVQYVNLDEICFPSAQQSAPKYNFTFIQEWNVVLCSMTNSTEVGVLGLNGDTKRWQIWNLDGNGRAELPTTSGGKDSFPNGLALDLTAAAALRLDESRSLPPMPILLILSTDGVLLPFHVVNTNPNISVLTKPAEISIAGSQRPNLVGEQQPKDRIEVVPLPQSVSQRQPEVSAPPAATVNNRKRMESGCIAQQAVVIQANEVALNETVQNEKLQKQQEEERRLNDVYQTALVEELVNFQRELKDLKKFLSSNSPSLGSGEERTTLSRTLESAERRTEDLSEEMKILRLNAGALRSECFDCLANAEEAKLRDKRRSLPEYQLLMRSMPLDSDLEKKLRRARLAVRQIQDSFDNTTAKLSAVRKPKRHGTPTRPL